jgi:hypothetical protein
LRLLRRLEHQKIIRDLPETRVEQSFNEQLFARILDYRTLLSHDDGEFHLLPKNLTGPRRFDDFSLGFFGVRHAVFGTAEFKSPGVDLDAPQSDASYGGRTPVEQAFTAISGLPSCRWILVSNFQELRLYSAQGRRLLAVAELHEVRSHDDLADLMAHFDRSALLPARPEKGTSGMSDALKTDFAGAPLSSAPDSFRIVARFTPTRVDAVTPLAALERALRVALETSERFRTLFCGDSSGDPHEQPRAPIRLDDGWACVEATGSNGPLSAVRVAASRRGQVVVSARCTYQHGHRRVSMYQVQRVLSLFVRIVIGISGSSLEGEAAKTGGTIDGEVGLDLRDVRDSETLHPEPISGVRDSFNIGRCDQDDLFAGDFRSGVTHDVVGATAMCLCDLAVQFRDNDACGIMLAEGEVCRDLRRGAT